MYGMWECAALETTNNRLGFGAIHMRRVLRCCRLANDDKPIYTRVTGLRNRGGGVQSPTAESCLLMTELISPVYTIQPVVKPVV